MIDRLMRRMVCLDFSRGQLAAVELADGSVTRWFSRPVPKSALRNGDPEDADGLGRLVRQQLADAGIASRRARIALPDEATVSRVLTLPVMPKRDLTRAMRYAAERHLPFPITRARWSWDVIESDQDRLKVYLVGAWHDVVESYTELVRAAGLEPQIVEPRSLAVARALNQEEAILLDGTEQGLHLTLFVAGRPALIDDVAAGPDLNERREALERLLQDAFRYQSTVATGPRRLAPVLLAGDLDASGIGIPVTCRPVTRVLNGSLPKAPKHFRADKYLANLGLAMRS